MVREYNVMGEIVDMMRECFQWEMSGEMDVLGQFAGREDVGCIIGNSICWTLIRV